MALNKVGEAALAVKDLVKGVKPIKEQPAKKVLDEDTYTENIEKIIVRDFYPDLPKLKAQSEYLDALKGNDVAKLRELHIKYGSKRPTANSKTPSIYSTPATFETPETRHQQNDSSSILTEGQQGDEPSAPQEDEPQTHNPEPTKPPEKPALKLDQYLAKNTSEDNASFKEILKENETKLREKHSWLYKEEAEKKADKEQALALPSIEKQAIEGPRTQELQTWEYKSSNHLMYIPEGVEFTTNELIERQKKPREIKHQNTRFNINPFNVAKSKDEINQALQTQALNKEGKIGVDGKEVFPSATPSVNGFGFVATPSPVPGITDSPLMTWGEIEGTPFKLDASDTPVRATPGPQFRIPDIPNRDRLAHKLVEDASKAHRAKKEQALKRVSALASPSPKFGMASKTERLNQMSPAAQRLASTKLGIRTHTDKALRASYTPSPSRSPGFKTPELTPTGRRTPKSTRSDGTPGKRTSPSATDHMSFTDNLLNLPKRKKAEDFF